MQFKVTLFCVFASLILLSCGKKVKTFYDSGELMEKYGIEKNEGTKNGKYLRYYMNGKVAEEVNFLNGDKQGKRKLFNEDGSIESETDYVNGLINGEHNVFYPNGQVLLHSTYVSSQIVGLLTKYYESGGKMEEVLFDNDMENGPFTEYYENGQIKWKGSYRNGEHEFGILENFDDQGQLIKRMDCDSLGICKTIWKVDEK